MRVIVSAVRNTIHTVLRCPSTMQRASIGGQAASSCRPALCRVPCAAGRIHVAPYAHNTSMRLGSRALRTLHPLGTGASMRTTAAAAVQAVSTAPEQQPPAAAPAAAPRATKELPKNFDPAEGEQRLYQWWESSGYFQPNTSAPGTPFTVSMPPPNVTGKLHMGHAMFVTLQDIMVRYARMAGRPTLWLPGTDHAGIATQSVVEKQLAAGGSSRAELGRDAFVERVWAWKSEYGSAITNQLRRLGASCDWSRQRFTLDEGLSNAVAEAFTRLHEEGLIYRGEYMVNWSPKLGTAVSDLEVEYSEEPGFMYYFKYPIAGTDGQEFLPVASTRPETILGDTAVAVHPEDERYKHLVGRECEVPMGSGRRIKVIADEYVDREFGTGALKITPGHDPNDYEIGKRVGLEVLNIMNKDGTMNAAAGKYAGMDRFAARKQLWADMEAAGLAIKKEDYTIRVPRSQRGGEVVEPLVSDQWFVRMAPLAAPALEAVADGRITIVPERFAKVYNFWLENIKDWCISRQLWWGHRIPVWYVHDSQAAADAAEDGRSGHYVVARDAQEAAATAAQQFGEGKVLVQEQDVLDTWFSSGLWPFSTLGWPDVTAEDFKTFYPTQVMETGHDILFFWVARMIMMGMKFTGEVPFSTVYLHGLVKDDKGRKMSKSLGNVIDPLTVIDQYGTDALRFTMATGTAAGQDLNLSLDRVNANRNFTNKIWNVGKFILFQLQEVQEERWAQLAAADYSSAAAVNALPLTDRWVVSATHQLVDRLTAAQEGFEFSEAGMALYSFIWGEFADWYVEAAKARMYGGDAAAAATTQGVLVYCFNTLLKVAHPFMPYITEELWQALPHCGPALIAARWPATGAAACSQAVEQFEALKDVVRAVRNARAEYGVEPSRKIAATLVVADAQLRDALQQELAVICLLAKLEEAQVVGSADDAASSNDTGSSSSSSGSSQAAPSISVVVREGVQVLLPMAGLFDVEKELARLNKQKQKVEKELAGIQGRLNNPKFVSNAKPEYIQEVQKQAADAADRLAVLEGKLQQLQSLKQ